ncbi:hypothetical protein BZG35_02750 [Brevundimonas sp. LM2]|uniref:DUF3313 family protein n=1 Tax=Brevundimonas sp. LM2 TaxID=1938605 RepID=UPI000983F87F|nr:DUF3313 family protein [Brevundimonas sp. LM2]AQR60688.1 hypothetical protein BZG35_02750 [Brevundimonas sp. LM2]
MRYAPLLILAGLAVTACQTAPVADAGFLSRYDGLVAREDSLRASIRQRRDDAVAATVDRVHLEPSRFVGAAGSALTDQERAQLLREVDRQVCYEVSERFTLAADGRDVARLRTGVVEVRPTGAAGSGVAAVANILIPGPGTLRIPGTTGGLAVESELVGPGGEQIAALAWARNANTVGMDAPSLSRIGDALQMAEPLADEIGDTISQPDRVVRDIPTPDPCAMFGPRTQPVGFVTRTVTGLYVPQVNTGSAPATEAKPQP